MAHRSTVFRVGWLAVALAFAGMSVAGPAAAAPDTATITGQVVAPEGYTVAGMLICPWGGSGGMAHPMSSDLCTQLDAGGAFSFGALDPELSYTLKLEDPAGASDLISGFYPSGLDMAWANVYASIWVTPGATTTVEFDAVVGGTITGRVSVPAGFDPRELTVSADFHESAFPCDPWGGKSVTPTADGTFRISGVTPRETVVSLNSVDPTMLVLGHYPGNNHWCAPDEILDVASGEVFSGVDFAVPLGGAIAGTVTGQDGLAMADAVVNVCDATPPEEAIESWLVWPWSATAAADGSYLITGLPAGQYRVTAAEPNSYLTCADPGAGDGPSLAGVQVAAGATSAVDIALGTGFPDVSGASAFVGDIAWLVGAGITAGYADGGFHPTAPVSRQAMAAFLYRYAGSPAYTAPAVSPFNDVETSSQFYTEVCWLAAGGITGGYPDGGFHPTAAVSRQAMAAFLYRFAGSPAFTAPGTSPFTDLVTDSAFYQPVTWLADAGITGGYADGGFHPSAAVTRQAMAAFLHRYDTNVLGG